MFKPKSLVYFYFRNLLLIKIQLKWSDKYQIFEDLDLIQTLINLFQLLNPRTQFKFRKLI